MYKNRPVVSKEQLLKDVSDIIGDVYLHKFKCEHALHHLKYHFSDGDWLDITHATNSMYNPIYDDHVDIDKNISELIEYIWLNGISTTLSCENNAPENYIWIEFETFFDLEMFLEIVFKDFNSGDNFYDRGFPGWGINEGWYYEINATKNKKHKVSIDISVRFPRKDHNIILEKLKLNYESMISSKIQIDDSFSENNSFCISSESFDMDNNYRVTKLLMEEIKKRDAIIAQLRNKYENTHYISNNIHK